MVLAATSGSSSTASLPALSAVDACATPELALLVVLYLGLGGRGAAPGLCAVGALIGYLADLFAGSPAAWRRSPSAWWCWRARASHGRDVRRRWVHTGGDRARRRAGARRCSGALVVAERRGRDVGAALRLLPSRLVAARAASRRSPSASCVASTGGSRPSRRAERSEPTHGDESRCDANGALARRAASSGRRSSSPLLHAARRAAVAAAGDVGRPLLASRAPTTSSRSWSCRRRAADPRSQGARARRQPARVQRLHHAALHHRRGPEPPG